MQAAPQCAPGDAVAPYSAMHSLETLLVGFLLSSAALWQPAAAAAGQEQRRTRAVLEQQQLDLPPPSWKTAPDSGSSSPAPFHSSRTISSFQPWMLTNVTAPEDSSAAEVVNADRRVPSDEDEDGLLAPDAPPKPPEQFAASLPRCWFARQAGTGNSAIITYDCRVGGVEKTVGWLPAGGLV